MKVSKRKTRSDKFPLTLHPTGQYPENANRAETRTGFGKSDCPGSREACGNVGYGEG